jgi:hypothetical protein
MSDFAQILEGADLGPLERFDFERLRDLAAGLVESGGIRTASDLRIFMAEAVPGTSNVTAYASRTAPQVTVKVVYRTARGHRHAHEIPLAAEALHAELQAGRAKKGKG